MAFLETVSDLVGRTANSIGIKIKRPDGSWVMNRGLARKLVDDGEWFFVSLWSGMQIPLATAIDYLGEIKDVSSIPRLKKLLAKYALGYHASCKSKTYSYQGFTVTSFWGPDQYVPETIQSLIVKALFKLISPEASNIMIRELLSQCGRATLSYETIGVLTRFSLANQFEDLAPLFLEKGVEMKKVFDAKEADYKSGRGGLSYSMLYAYEELVYAAYRLTSIQDLKERALQILVQEYNHPDSKRKDYLHARPHDIIKFILCELVEKITTNTDEKNRIILMLDPEHFKRDMKYYKKYSAANC